jgi:hypothetical protein
MTQSLLFLTLITLSSWAFALPTDVANLHLALSGNNCEADIADIAPTQTISLGDGASLYIVPCFAGAYNITSYAYTRTTFEGLKPVIILVYNESSNSIAGSYELTNVDFNPTTFELTTFAKGRGLGDCGQSTVSVIDMNMGYADIVTKQIASKHACDGELDNWPVIFQQ